MLRYNIEKNHNNVTKENLIIAKNFKINKWKRSASLWIKDLHPTLNAQDKSVPLKLFHLLQHRNTCSDFAKDTRTVSIDTFLCLMC